MTRVTWDEYFMELAHAAASRGTCPRLQVGAILVKDKRVIGTGYNGSEPGAPHCDDTDCLMFDGSCIRTLHAEDNAVRSTTWKARAGSTLYCTDYPCTNCADRIAASGVVEVVWNRAYTNANMNYVDDLFNYHGIVIRQYGIIR